MATVPRSSEKPNSLAIEVAVKNAFESLGYTSVREEQMESARAILEGRDVFVCLPTGSGKSLCYGCLPLAFDTLRSVNARQVDCRCRESTEGTDVGPSANFH